MAEVVVRQGRMAVVPAGGALLRKVVRWWFRGWVEYVKAIGEPPTHLSGPNPWEKRS